MDQHGHSKFGVNVCEDDVTVVRGDCCNVSALAIASLIVLLRVIEVVRFIVLFQVAGSAVTVIEQRVAGGPLRCRYERPVLKIGCMLETQFRLM